MWLLDLLYQVYLPAKLDLSDGWVRQLEVSVHNLNRWAGHTVRTRELSDDLIRRFLADFLRDHLPSTTNNQRRNLLALWQCAWDEGLIDQPPRRNRIRRAKICPRVPEAWTPEQVARLLLAADQDKTPIAGLFAPLWWRSFLLCLYDTGERRGAALAVRTTDIQLADGWIVFRQTKTGRPRWCALHAETCMACARIYDPNRVLMWPWHASGPALEKRFRTLCKRADIPYGRERGGLFHKLRRTSGSLVEAAGGDGSRHLGNTRRVFEQSYLDPTLGRHSQLDRLPRPRM